VPADKVPAGGNTRPTPGCSQADQFAGLLLEKDKLLLPVAEQPSVVAAAVEAWQVAGADSVEAHLAGHTATDSRQPMPQRWGLGLDRQAFVAAVAAISWDHWVLVVPTVAVVAEAGTVRPKEHQDNRALAALVAFQVDQTAVLRTVDHHRNDRKAYSVG